MRSDSATTHTTSTTVAMMPRRLMRRPVFRDSEIDQWPGERSPALNLAGALVRQRRLGGTAHSVEDHAHTLEGPPVRGLECSSSLVRGERGGELVDVVVCLAEVVARARAARL